MELVRDCSLEGLFLAVELVAWLLRVTFLPWRGGVGFLGRGPAPLFPGRQRSSLAGLLLRMSVPIPRPRGCSEIGHVGCGPLTGWHWW